MDETGWFIVACVVMAGGFLLLAFTPLIGEVALVGGLAVLAWSQ